MRRRTLPPQLNFKARSKRRVDSISNILTNISTDVLDSARSGSTIDLDTARMATAGGEERRRPLPGEIIMPKADDQKEEEEERGGRKDEKEEEEEAEQGPSSHGRRGGPAHRQSLAETRIVVDGVESPSPSPSPIPHGDEPVAVSRSLSVLSSSRLQTDTASQLSFIVKEKLHEFARDLRRRTSAVRDEVIREPTPEGEEDEAEGRKSSMEGGINAREAAREREQHASLMSLIGLHQEAELDDIVAEPSRLLPRHIDTFSKLYVGWLSFVLIAFLYNAFVIPLRCSYPYQTRANLRYWLLCDYTCDLIYLLDLLLVKPRLTFMRDGITVKDPSAMLAHYLHSGLFKLDLLALCPLDLMYFITGPISAWRLFHLLKLPSFWEFFDLLDSSFSNPYAVRIAKTFCYMIYIIHCNSCVYYVLSAWQAFGQIPYSYKGKWYLNKWVYNNEGNAYIRCFYFTAAVATSTGNNPAPTNVIEYVYMTCSWMMGVFVFALLLGQIRDIVSNANKNNEEFRTTMDKTLYECKRLDLPEQLTARVRSWFLYTWERQRTLEEKKLVEKLPLKLQTDLALSVHYNTLSKVKLFQDADRAFLRDLVLRLQPSIYLPGDMICRKGDVGKEMYIVNNGILEVVGGEQNELVFATLAEGSVFGEISLLAIGGNNRRTANIRSKGYSTLFVLSKEDLNDVIKDYPDAQQLLKKRARLMLRKDQQGTESAAEARKNLIERCRVSCDLRTPRMLAAVAKLLPPESQTAKQLTKAMAESAEGEEKRRMMRMKKEGIRDRHPLKRWSTLPPDSEYSETDFPFIDEEPQQRPTTSG